MKRTYIKRKTTKKKRQTPQEIYDEVYERSGGRCEWESGGLRCQARGEQMAHMKHRQMGGTTSEEIHSADNIKFLCRYHHDRWDGRG